MGDLPKIVVLEDTKELMSYTSPEEIEAQQRVPFDLLVCQKPISLSFIEEIWH